MAMYIDKQGQLLQRGRAERVGKPVGAMGVVGCGVVASSKPYLKL